MDNQVYKGDEMIVIAIDLGTTYSGVAYSYLYPNTKPEVRLVNSWPGQPEASGDSKIPTIIAYKGGVAEALGAEARDFMGDNEYEIAEWFKLHLHPDTMKISDEPPQYDNVSNELPKIKIPALPSRVTLLQVYSDFLKYLYSTTKAFFQGDMPNGRAIWERLQNKITLVLCTPNGWDINEQHFLRRAVVNASIMMDNEAEERLEFVTEGEASVHFILAHRRSEAWLKKGAIFCVMDAGGSTVDSTLYECKQTDPSLVLEEVCASECVQAGGVFVNSSARTFLQNKLKNSKYGDEESVTLMVEDFEKKVKRLFDGTQESNIIHFGRNSDTDRSYNIIKGRISLNKEETKRLFDAVAGRILNSCLRLLKGQKVLYILLVGGFGESPFLRRYLASALGHAGTDIVTVKEPSKKAAAEGAGIWFIKRMVVARAARFTFGTGLRVAFNPAFANHCERSHLKVLQADGSYGIDHVSEVWLSRNSVLDNNFEKVFEYCTMYSSFPIWLGKYELEVLAWDGENPPYYCRDLNGVLVPGVRHLCTLTANMSVLEDVVEQRQRLDGLWYWNIPFKVRVKFGGTRVRAQLEWNQGGRVHQGPVTILPRAAI